jgi:ubiquinone/menaquinone biosynthesis C-methylase UbiE
LILRLSVILSMPAGSGQLPTTPQPCPRTRGFIDDLLDAAGVKAGMRVLDLACGPGLVASGAAERGALPVGLYFCSAMIVLARADHPGIRFEEADAEVLPFADESFDAVVANFGIHHVAEPNRALAEARRVLRPGGRVAFTSGRRPLKTLRGGFCSRRSRRMATSKLPIHRPQAGAFARPRIS